MGSLQQLLLIPVAVRSYTGALASQAVLSGLGGGGGGGEACGVPSDVCVITIMKPSYASALLGAFLLVFSGWLSGSDVAVKGGRCTYVRNRYW